jgi:hypothetical protein
MSYDDHVSDTVLFVKLTRQAVNAEVGLQLCPLKAQFIADGIDGIVMLETPQKFRVTP